MSTEEKLKELTKDYLIFVGDKVRELLKDMATIEDTSLLISILPCLRALQGSLYFDSNILRGVIKYIDSKSNSSQREASSMTESTLLSLIGLAIVDVHQRLDDLGEMKNRAVIMDMPKEELLKNLEMYRELMTESLAKMEYLIEHIKK